MQLRFVAALLFAVFLSGAYAARAEVVVLSASKDNTLYESSSGNLSNGAGQHFFAGATAGNAIRRGLIAFDIAGAISAGATIESVELTLHMSRTNTSDRFVDLHSVLNDWGEGESHAGGQEGGGAQAEPNDATWLHTFYDAEFWDKSGGDFRAKPSASIVVFGNDFYTWGSTTDMVDDVQTWLDDAQSNFGWLVRGDEASDTTAKRFDTREHPDEALHPSLRIEFTPPIPDCNGNGIDDAQDIANGTSQDCNNNGVPDECDVDPKDPDGDGKVSPDCDGNGVPDECQPDSDGDGVIDVCDNCPDDPAKNEPGDCGCGQPDTDTDGDGLPDCLDACPDDPNKFEPGDCGCGQPDTDTDGDGLPDCLDACPDDPNKFEPGDCGCGQPDTDTDGDGVPDCLDACPDDPNKFEPGDCGCDEPDVDSDGDGVPDCLDGCPSDPDKTEPGDCGCGTPDTDNDGDGVPDCLDICPGEDDQLDRDNDGVPDCLDICPGSDDNLDDDGDGVPDACDVCPGSDDNADADDDGVPDCIDNCPDAPNADQLDSDGDGVGDACDSEDAADIGEDDGTGASGLDRPDSDGQDDQQNDAAETPSDSNEPIPDCGAGLCGPGCLSAIPLILLGITYMKAKRPASRRRRSPYS